MRSFFKALVTWIITAEAKAVLLRRAPTVIAITGSMGKTSTKDAIYAALSPSLHVRKSAKSLNTDFGVPLAILGLESGWDDPFAWIMNMVRGAIAAFGKGDYPSWLVLEVGADRPGDIGRIARWLRPHVVVLTGIPDVPPHVEYFPSPDALAKEKALLVEHMRASGMLIVNGDNERAAKIAEDFGGSVVTYGWSARHDVAASHESVHYEDGAPAGMHASVTDATGTWKLRIAGALGRPRVYSALAALAVAEYAGVTHETALAGLAAWEPTPGRMRILPGIKGTTIIDDTYNSSPAAARSALETLKRTKAKRRIALLGDMLELGRFSVEEHRKLGEIAAASADVVWTVGVRSRATLEAVRDAGLPEHALRAFEHGESARAGKELEAELQEGDLVLIKGSQGMRMERAVLEVMAEPARAKDLLCRQEEEWVRR